MDYAEEEKVRPYIPSFQISIYFIPHGKPSRTSHAHCLCCGISADVTPVQAASQPFTSTLLHHGTFSNHLHTKGRLATFHALPPWAFHTLTSRLVTIHTPFSYTGRLSEAPQPNLPFVLGVPLLCMLRSMPCAAP